MKTGATVMITASTSGRGCAGSVVEGLEAAKNSWMMDAPPSTMSERMDRLWRIAGSSFNDRRPTKRHHVSQEQRNVVRKSDEPCGMSTGTTFAPSASSLARLTVNDVSGKT
jgi:hypothetical protein